MPKKSKEGQEAKSVEYLKQMKRNPLADYQKQIKANRRTIEKTIGDTSIGDDIRLELMGLSPEQKIYIWDEIGDMNFGKLMASAKNRNLIMSLSASTLKLFLWIIYALKFRGDVVTLDLAKMEKLGFQMANGTFRNSIKELEDNKIIRRVGQKKDDYWMFFINPQILFKGDAKRFYNDVLRHHPEYLKPE